MPRLRDLISRNGLLVGLLDDLTQGKLTVVAAFSIPPYITLEPYLLSQIVLNRLVLVFNKRSSNSLDDLGSAVII